MTQPTSDQDLLVSTLKRFDPLQNLSDAHLAQLSRGATAFTMSKRQQLLGADEHRWMVFLVSGSVQTKTHNGVEENVRAKHENQPPLFDRNPRPAELIALEETQLVRVDRKQFSVLMNQQIASSTLVQELDIADNVRPLFDKIISAYTARDLKVPVDPNAVARLEKVLQLGEPDRELLVEMLRKDPFLALHMTSFAVMNSESFARSGLTKLEQLAIGIDTDELILYLKTVLEKCPWPDEGSVLLARLRRASDYLCSVGHFCRLIAERIEDVDPLAAEMAGMFSGCGVATLLLTDPELAERLEAEKQLDDAVFLLKGLVTELVMIRLGIDKRLIKAVELATSGKPTLSQAIQLGDICRVATEYLPIDVNGNRVQLVDDSVLITRLGRKGLGLRDLDVLLEQCYSANDGNRRIA
ncbi:MAG: cyclic nucleotide-binding domain-containing protein [Pseudomonadota bacterium]